MGCHSETQPLAMLDDQKKESAMSFNIKTRGESKIPVTKVGRTVRKMFSKQFPLLCKIMLLTLFAKLDFNLNAVVTSEWTEIVSVHNASELILAFMFCL